METTFRDVCKHAWAVLNKPLWESDNAWYISRSGGLYAPSRGNFVCSDTYDTLEEAQNMVNRMNDHQSNADAMAKLKWERV